MKKYDWKQLSQWDNPRPEYHTKTKKVGAGVSEAICTCLLVEQVDTGGGYIRTIPIYKSAVTPEILEIAGSL